MKINLVIVYTLAVALVLTACGGGQIAAATAAPSAEPVETRAIVLGDISDDPAEVIDGTQPLADYLASQLGDYGITEGQVRVASSTDEMASLLASRVRSSSAASSCMPRRAMSTASIWKGEEFLMAW